MMCAQSLSMLRLLRDGTRAGAEGDRVDFATTLSIPDGSQDAVIEAFEAYLKATKRGHFKHNQIASLLHGFKLDGGRSPMMRKRTSSRPIRKQSDHRFRPTSSSRCGNFPDWGPSPLHNGL